MGALLLASTQPSDLDGEPEVIWLKKGTIFDPISCEGEKQVNVAVFCPSSHHDECSDYDRVLGFKRHENRTLVAIVILIWIGHGVQHGNFGLCGHERLACNHDSDDHIDHENGFKNVDDPSYGDSRHDLKRVCLENEKLTSQRAVGSLDSESYDENMRSMLCHNHLVCRSDRDFLCDRVFPIFRSLGSKRSSYEQQHVSCRWHLFLD